MHLAARLDAGSGVLIVGRGYAPTQEQART